MKKSILFYTFISILFINVSSAQTEAKYYIRLFNNNILEASAGSVNDNGCRIQLWKNLFTKNQQWDLIKTKNGTFRIKNLSSNKYIEVKESEINQNGGKVQLWDEVPGSKNQEWIFQEIGKGKYSIRNAASSSNKILDVFGAAINKMGAAIHLWDYSAANTSNQIWYLDRVEPLGGVNVTPVGSGNGKIYPRPSGVVTVTAPAIPPPRQIGVNTEITLYGDEVITRAITPVSLGRWFCPTELLRGDREFDGNNTEVRCDVEIELRNNNTEIWAKIFLSGRELSPDYSTTEGNFERKIYTASRGVKIDTILSETFSKVVFIANNKTPMNLFLRNSSEAHLREKIIQFFNGSYIPTKILLAHKLKEETPPTEVIKKLIAASGNGTFGWAIIHILPATEGILVDKFKISVDSFGPDISDDTNCHDDFAIHDIEFFPIVVVLSARSGR